MVILIAGAVFDNLLLWFFLDTAAPYFRIGQCDIVAGFAFRYRFHTGTSVTTPNKTQGACMNIAGVSGIP